MAFSLLNDDVGVQRAGGLDRLKDRDGAAGVDVHARSAPATRSATVVFGKLAHRVLLRLR